MRIGQAGLQLITEFEDLKLKSYRDIAGVWTIGYGTTRINGISVSSGMEINETVALALLEGDLSHFTYLVSKAAIYSLTQNQFDALVSFAYNIGEAAFTSSSLLQSLNHKLEINEDLFTRWNKYTDPLTKQKLTSNGLTRRRKAEYALFISREA